MAYIQGRVQSSSTGGGIPYAFIKDNFNQTATCDQYGLFYSTVAYYPGYQITASAGGFQPRTEPISADEWANKFMLIELTPATSTSSCFTGDTLVTMANGDTERIDLIRPGDRVLGHDGSINTVREVEAPLLGGRPLYAINGGPPFMTAEHPLLSVGGWQSVDPDETRREYHAARVHRLRVGATLVRGQAVASRRGGAIATVPAIRLGEIALRALSLNLGEPDLKVYNLLLNGGHTYLAAGFVAHNKGGGGW